MTWYTIIKVTPEENAKALVIKTANQLDYVSIEGDYVYIKPEWMTIPSNSIEAKVHMRLKELFPSFPIKEKHIRFNLSNLSEHERFDSKLLCVQQYGPNFGEQLRAI